MKEYYKVRGKPDNDKPYAEYYLGINWLPKQIINDQYLKGYIVQKVKIFNNTGIENISNIEYYEAWKVINGKIDYNGKENINVDDAFSFFSEIDQSSTIKLSLGKCGIIKYDAVVYWINFKDPLYEKIDCWKYGGVREAGDLKSALVSKCPELALYNPIFTRPTFEHRVSFVDFDTVHETIKELYINRIKKKDLTLYNELKSILENTNYSNISDIICGDWEIDLKN